MDKLLNTPFSLVGIPFKYSGRNQSGLDCWGLVMEVYSRLGVLLPDYELCNTYDFISKNSYDSASTYIDGVIKKQKWEWERVSSPTFPSVIALRFNHPTMINHVGVYLNNGLFIHTRDRVGACLDKVDSKSWAKKIEGFYKYKGSD